MADFDETIRIKYTVDAVEAIETNEELRAQIDELKKQIKKDTKEIGDSFEVINKSIRRIKIKEFEEDIKSLRAELSATRKVGSPIDVEAAEAALNEARKDLKEFKESSTQALKEVNQEARQFIKIMNMFRGINIAATKAQFRELKDTTKQTSESMKEAGTSTQSFVDRLKGAVSSIDQLGGVAKFVFGTILGVGAVQALRKIIDVFREAISISLEFQQSLFTLEVAVRGLQRMGLDTTIAGWDKRVEDLKKQFPIFSRREFVDAAALAALMTREFGFTEAQIADLVRQSAILAEITGKDLFESVRGITFAIGSGYFESLQRAGINISRQVVATEALAQGYDGVYNELEPVIRASVTYAVIQNNLNAIQEDAGKIVETTAGQVKNLKAKWDDFLVTLGSVITDTDDAKEAIEGLALSLQLLTEVLGLISDAEMGGVSILELILGPNYPTFLRDLPEINKQFAILIEKINELRGIREPILDDFIDEDVVSAFKDFTVGDVEFSKEDYEEIIDATEDLVEEIHRIEEESFEKRQDALDKFVEDSVDKWQNHSQKLIDLQKDLNRRLADIGLKESQNIADEIANNAFRVQEVIRKAAIRREEAERKFRERELKEERKFQEKLRQLRENFLLNLEDAVRERDARQIIRLIRQFNLRRTQMVREEKLNKGDREGQFQEELSQIERQKQERLRQLAVEHQRRLDSIAQQAQRERAQAQLNFERRQEEERLRFEREKEDRKERLGELLESIDESTQERINKVIQGLEEEYGLSKDQLDAIALLYEQTYGPDGRIDQAVAYTIARLTQLAQWMNILRTKMGTLPVDPIRREKEFNSIGGQAEGGTFIARKPTLALFGEAGPEVADFTPLGRLGSKNTFGGQMPVSSRESPFGRLRLELLLSQDLEARIIDQALDEVADVAFTIERERA